MGLELHLSWSLVYTYIIGNGAYSTSRVIFGRISREGNDRCINRNLELGSVFEGSIPYLPGQSTGHNIRAQFSVIHPLP
jgi:hypothetical protein